MQKKLKPGLVANYDIQPGKGETLFLFRCFINLSVTYLLIHLPTYSPGDPPTRCTTVRPIRMCVHCTVHNCCTQYCTEQILIIVRLTFRQQHSTTTTVTTCVLAAIFLLNLGFLFPLEFLSFSSSSGTDLF